MKNIGIVMALLAATTMAGQANAAACRDAKGHFIKCATAPAAPAPAARAAPAVRQAATHAAAPTKRCRNTKGQFAKCETTGVKPI